MIWLLIQGALAGPVRCDPDDATRLLTDARIDESDVARTHPFLVPGLARASAHSSPELKTVLNEICAPGGELTVATGDTWMGSGWSARTIRLTRTEVDDCTLLERSILLSVGQPEGQPPTYTLQAAQPYALTPLGECDTQARWLEHTVLAGEESPIRVVLESLRQEDRVVHASVRARVATPEGWREQVLLEQAPQRYTGGFSGPSLHLVGRESDWLIVATHDREGTVDACAPVPGQVVWQLRDHNWQRTEGRAALRLLTQRGQWRLAGEPGWALMLAIRTLDEGDTARARAERLSRQTPDEPLLVLDAGDFPMWHAGFWVVTPTPWPTAEAVEAHRRDWGRMPRAYVRQAWPAPDPCAPDADGG